MTLLCDVLYVKGITTKHYCKGDRVFGGVFGQSIKVASGRFVRVCVCVCELVDKFCYLVSWSNIHYVKRLQLN